VEVQICNSIGGTVQTVFYLATRKIREEDLDSFPSSGVYLSHFSILFLFLDVVSGVIKHKELKFVKKKFETFIQGVSKFANSEFRAL
jgi:hypothetical protein